MQYENLYKFFINQGISNSNQTTLSLVVNVTRAVYHILMFQLTVVKIALNPEGCFGVCSPKQGFLILSNNKVSQQSIL